MDRTPIELEAMATVFKHTPEDHVAIALNLKAAVQEYDTLSRDFERALDRAADPEYEYKSGRYGPYKQITAEDIADSLNLYGIPVTAELEAREDHWIPEMVIYAFGCILKYEEFIDATRVGGEL